MTLAMQLVLLGAVLGACSGGGEGEPDGAAAPTGADIDVTVRYDGALVGDLIVGAFLSNPPAGGPLAFHSLAAPAFPVSVTLSDLAPDTYYVIAVLDLLPVSPTVPGPEDLLAASEPLAVERGDERAVELTITEPNE